MRHGDTLLQILHGQLWACEVYWVTYIRVYCIALVSLWTSAMLSFMYNIHAWDQTRLSRHAAPENEPLSFWPGKEWITKRFKRCCCCCYQIFENSLRLCQHAVHRNYTPHGHICDHYYLSSIVFASWLLIVLSDSVCLVCFCILYLSLWTQKGSPSAKNVVIVLVLAVVAIRFFFENSLRLCQYATDRN